MKRIFTIILAIILFTAACAPKEPVQPAFDVQAELSNAERLFLEGNYEEVILTLETVLEIEPANVRGYLMLADTYIAKGEAEKALELLKKGLEKTGDEQIAARIQGMTKEITGIVDVGTDGWTTFLLSNEDELYYCGAPYDDGVGNSLVPTKIEGANNIVKLFVQPGGCYYITSDDALWGVGYCAAPLESDYNNSQSDFTKPRKIMDGVRSVASYGNSGMILKTDGKLYSWGTNEDGELGIGLPYKEEWDVGWSSGSEYEEDTMQLVMEDVIDMDYRVNPYVQGMNVCAVTSDGGLYLWGHTGETEENGEYQKICYNTPQKIYEGIAKAKIYCGGIIAIDNNDCLLEIQWDRDNLNNLQVSGYFADENGISQRVGLSDPEHAKAARFNGMTAVQVQNIDCGDDFFIALGVDGGVYTGGHNNSSGQLGTLDEEYDHNKALYMPIENTKALTVSADGGSAFAVTEDGKLLAWGNNEIGQLGNGRSGVQRDDEQKHLILSGVKEVIADDYRSAYAIMENDDLYAWGYSVNSSLGIKTEEESITAPTKVFENVKTVALGGADTLVLTNDGEVYSCYPYIGETHERNNFKEIANERTMRHEKYPNFYKVFEGVKDVHSLAGSYFVLFQNGELWGWGKNFNCLLGNGTKTDQSLTENQTIYEPVLLMEDVEDITGATLFLKKNGDVYYCGPSFPDDILTPELVVNEMELIFESALSEDTYMLDSDGQLYCFEYCGAGKPELLSLAEKVVDIDLSRHNSGLFIDSQNNLYEVIYDKDGTNHEGCSIFRLGEEDYDDIEDGQFYKKIAENAISCAFTSNSDGTYYYVTLEGDLYSWGSNDYGLLGIGDARQDENIFEVKLPE